LDVATGDILLFTDDDCLVAADWALRASDCFGSTLMQVVGGRIELANPTDLEITIRTSPEPETLRSANDLLGFMHGANFAVGRPALDRIGRFDPVFGAGTWLRSAEDSDFIYRAFVLGLPVRYEPGFVVRHDHGRSGRHDRTKLERAYCTGNGALLAKALLEGRGDLVRPIYWGCREALRAWKAHPADWRVLWPKVSLLTGFLRFMSITFWHRVLGR
jgi:GT2 family glycosyltransferase